MEKFIERCVPYLQTRLGDSSGDIFDVQDLKKFIRISISANAPFARDDDPEDLVFKIQLDNIVSHAVYQALTAQALKEKGREFKDVTTYLPPKPSETLLYAAKQEYDTWRDRMTFKETYDR